MFAIVDIAGTQELVQQGAKLRIPLMQAKQGDTVRFDRILLVSDGDRISVGSPAVEGVVVEGTILCHGRGGKIRVVKAHRRKRYRRVRGHRQHFTEIEVTGVTVR